MGGIMPVIKAPQLPLMLEDSAPEAISTDDNASSVSNSTKSSSSSSNSDRLNDPKTLPKAPNSPDKARKTLREKQPTITTHFISLRKPLRRTMSTPNLISMSDASSGIAKPAGVEVTHVHTISAAPKDSFGIPMLPFDSELDLSKVRSLSSSPDRGRNPSHSSQDGSESPESDISADPIDDFDYNVWSTVLHSKPLVSSYESVDDEAMWLSSYSHPPLAPDSPQLPSSILASKAPRSFQLNNETRERVEEFVHGFLGLSVFDSADVWYAEGSDSLTQIFTMASETAPSEFNYFKSIQATTVNAWDGAIGRAFATSSPVWESNKKATYDTQRASILHSVNVNTVLAVPIVNTPKSHPSFIICFYSRDEVECVPFALRFVQQAVKLVWNDVKPSETDGIWQDVSFSHLGEMAGDFDTQQNFSRKRNHDTFEDMAGLDLDRGAPTEGGSWILNSTSLPAKTFVQNQQAQMKLRYMSGLSHQMGSIGSRLYSNASGSINNMVNPDPSSNPRAFKRRNSNPSNDLDRSYHGPSYDTATTSSDFMGVGTGEGSTVDPLGASVHGYPSVNYSTSFDPYGYSEGDFQFTQQYGGHQAYQQQQHPGYGPGYGPPGTESSYGTPPGAYQSAAAGQFQVGTPPASTATTTKKKGTKNSRKKSSTSKASTTVNGVKVCRILGCDDLAIARRPYCLKHSGSRQCEFPGGCAKCAQGSTRFCIAHGGGRRCTFLGCDKGARDKYFCAAHGGGKRCCVEGCNKSAVGGSAQCTSHGGGKRCKVQGCDKSAQSSTNFCVRHGGGKKCAHVDAASQKRCDKVARGRTDYCASHGGGVRCKLDNCNRVAIGKLQLCRAHGQQNAQLMAQQGLTMQGTMCVQLQR